MQHPFAFFPNFEPCAMAKKKNSVQFESKLQQIKLIADRMQAENLSLDESMALFREADALIQACRAYLQEAAVEVEMLIHPDGEATQPFS